MNQKELMAHIAKNCRIPFNPVLFERSDDKIADELKKVILSCQRDSKYFNITVVNFEVVDDYATINQILFEYYENAYRNKSKAKRKDNQYAYINLNETAIRLLLIDYHIETPMAIDENERVDDFRVVVAIPRIVDRYYIKINGIIRSTLYQIVDGSTYNNSSSNSKIPNITFKIVFMAARVFRYYLDAPIASGENYRLTHYMSNIFSKTTSALKYILAKYGLEGSMQFLGLPFVKVSNRPSEDPNDISFCKDEGLWVSAPKYLVDNEPVLQSLVACVYQALVPGMNYEIAYDPQFWVRSLGGDFNNTSMENMLRIIEKKETAIHDTLEKGYSILDSFENIYDLSTKESIRLPDKEKDTMYHVLRWIVREFNKLRLKDNLDVGIKKIRFAEYIASLYAMKVARGIYRVADHGSKIDCSSIRRAIRTDPLYLVNTIAKSNLVNYRNMVSDMDAMLALKYTYKGIAGLGENGGKSIPENNRHTHPSHLGRLDLDNSPDTSPGITGSISPFTQVYDGYFSDYQEPNSWEEKFMQTLSMYQQALRKQDTNQAKQDLLGIVDEEQTAIDNEVVAAMSSIMAPYLVANQGEIIYPIIFNEVEV